MAISDTIERNQISREPQKHRSDVVAAERVQQRANELLATARERLYTTIDRMFAGLMLLQWIAGIGLALFISPLTWIGASAELHVHVWAAIFLGAAISSLPIYLALRHPGKPYTRHTIAFAQALWSALLIHLSGGRIETHFHVFGSLAFLAFYRDWRVLITASAVVAVDHFVRGLWWPQSVFGVILTSPFRWIEHAAWVIFEDIFLIASCRRGDQEMIDSAHRQAELEVVNATVEAEIEQRTEALRRATDALEEANANLRTEAARLAATNSSLESEIKRREQAQRERDAMQQQLLRASRAAGMAEMATGVLHNVGNVLNSINVSAGLTADQLRQSSVPSLQRAVDMLLEHRDNLTEFFASDVRAPKLLDFLQKISDRLAYENRTATLEIASLVDKIDHVKEIVRAQQNYARSGSVIERLEIPSLIDGAVESLGAELAEQNIELRRTIDTIPPIEADKHKLLQILINLLNNAQQALLEVDRTDRRIDVRVFCPDNNRMVIAVRDNGVGIAPEMLTAIFQYGFTTKKEGHGFGLHSCALAAKELGGKLTARSDGPGRGAEFLLELPLKAPQSVLDVEKPSSLDSAPNGNPQLLATEAKKSDSEDGTSLATFSGTNDDWSPIVVPGPPTTG